MNTDTLEKKFRELYNKDCSLYTSPGRINLIGEHTDYNGGYVMPGAIDKGIFAAIAPNGTDKVNVFSMDYNESCTFGMQEEDKPEKQWARYIFGVIREMAKRGFTAKGFDAVFAGDVPLGAGMSSSAALESCFACALNDIYSLGIDRMTLAKIGQMTEHNYCGVNCGIMDQFASVFGKEGHLIRLNCDTMQYEYFPFSPKGYRLVLIDTKVKHELASSAYNKRRESCENVLKTIQTKHPEVKTLSDAAMDMLNEVKGEISKEDFLRAKYVIDEKQRVIDTCAALERGDMETAGRCMYGTHHGMSKEYEVSCQELDFLNDIAFACGVTGSRVMGGGFGGCTINLVKSERYSSFVQTAVSSFNKTFHKEPAVYDVVISDGARKLK